MLPHRNLMMMAALSLAVFVNSATNAAAEDVGREQGSARSEVAQVQPLLTSPDFAAGKTPANTVPPRPGAETTETGADDLWQRATLTGDWNGLRTSLQDAGIKFGLQEQSEVWANLTGGLRRGVVYDGLTTASVTLDLEKLAGWTGATFFVDAYQIHGRGPSANLVGNLQIVSNIEATRDTKLYQLWVEQQLLDGRLIVRIGQEGANDQMMITQYGALFLNSSFGFPGLPAADLPSGGPNYPMATPFIRAQFQATDQVTLVGAVFNGDPAPPGAGDPQLRDRGGDAFRLNDHVLAFGELWYGINQDDGAAGLPGMYKLGAWYDSAHFPDQLLDTMGRTLANPASTGIPRGHSTGFAVYGIVDQMIWRKPGSKDLGIGVFLQVMGAPDTFNLSNLFIEGGLNWKGPFEGRESDVFGLGVSYLGISPATRRFGSDVVAFTGTGSPYQGNETVVEATYLYQVAPWWTLQPDMQVVVNPGAGIPSSFSRTPLKNAFIGGVRATVTF
ncbi:MAG: carbohydrate porin [Rhodopila sp.]|nr:carbohydrate porin [Rhodopila sp.]